MTGKIRHDPKEKIVYISRVRLVVEPKNGESSSIAKELMDSPVDPNIAKYSELLRVPGIGPGSARRIMALRRQKKIIGKEELAHLGVRIKRAAPFMMINGWKDTTLEMWS